jgi:hypothetical protein
VINVEAARKVVRARRIGSSRVALGITPPRLPQIRTCGIPASGSSD